MEDERLEKALETCKMFVRNNANIQVVGDSSVFYDKPELGSITFHSYDTSSIECLIDKIRDDQILLKSLEKSDTSKENSSMAYYNAYREYKEKFEFISDVIMEMAKFITVSSDEFKSAEECEYYFKEKVRDKYENRNK